MDDVQFVDIRPFVTAPAHVEFSASRTLNLGNYESAKVTVGVTLPCYVQEVEKALKRAESICEQFLNNKIAEIEQQLGVRALAQNRGK